MLFITFVEQYFICNIVLRQLLSSDRKLSGSLKNLLGFYPGNIALYQMAFRHKSMVKDG